MSCLYILKAGKKRSVGSIFEIGGAFDWSRHMFWRLFKVLKLLNCLYGVNLRNYFETSCLDILKTGKKRSVWLIFENWGAFNGGSYIPPRVSSHMDFNMDFPTCHYSWLFRQTLWNDIWMLVFSLSPVKFRCPTMTTMHL